MTQICQIKFKWNCSFILVAVTCSRSLRGDGTVMCHFTVPWFAVRLILWQLRLWLRNEAQTVHSRPCPQHRVSSRHCRRPYQFSWEESIRRILGTSTLPGEESLSQQLRKKAFNTSPSRVFQCGISPYTRQQLWVECAHRHVGVQYHHLLDRLNIRLSHIILSRLSRLSNVWPVCNFRLVQ
jgi:hypothetical protein